jgi:hypothetical protein
MCGTHTSVFFNLPPPPLPSIPSLSYGARRQARSPPSVPPHHRLPPHTGRRADANLPNASGSPSYIAATGEDPGGRPPRLELARSARGRRNSPAAGGACGRRSPRSTAGGAGPRLGELAVGGPRGRDWSSPAAGWPLGPELIGRSSPADRLPPSQSHRPGLRG